MTGQVRPEPEQVRPLGVLPAPATALAEESGHPAQRCPPALPSIKGNRIDDLATDPLDQH